MALVKKHSDAEMQKERERLDAARKGNKGGKDSLTEAYLQESGNRDTLAKPPSGLSPDSDANVPGLFKPRTTLAKRK